jgi:hypothetical protein
MQASRRWRDWNPPEIIQESAERELTKLTEPQPGPILSVLSVPTLPVSEIIVPSASIPAHDPAEWREPFVRWLESACVLSPRCFGGATEHGIPCGARFTAQTKANSGDPWRPERLTH